jgi:acyl carrier protein
MDMPVKHSREEVLETVARLLREVMGDEEGLGVPITLETSFNQDLELESIEFVAAAEKIRECYGPKVDFAAWLSGMELDQILALRVEDLVEFILKCL